ncbi:aminomethyltransferase, mitochondrial-like [Rhipicephalus sanguineus]|uniref:aminomethyltransferase, mitochondrial-like n=1 Tax=Rhipicephalus sanguineus TaxID=34632 RepID=UPI0020C34B74|nr:aminomethyltransferase, mitochondrial-like [Rhipicephalus sanguineus]
MPSNKKYIPWHIISTCKNITDVHAKVWQRLGTLTVYTNQKGGIIDDLREQDQGLAVRVSNAGCRDKDLAHVKAKLADFQAAGNQATLELMDSWSLLAIQGPAAAELLQPLVDCTIGIAALHAGCHSDPAGIPGCRLTRCGYTGEDGLEVLFYEGPPLVSHAKRIRRAFFNLNICMSHWTQSIKSTVLTTNAARVNAKTVWRNLAGGW